MDPIVINLAAGPGAGKSTSAASLFSKMKLEGHKVELVTEYAKDLTYEKNWPTLGNQLKVLGEQHHRLARLKGQVDFIITDAPLFLGAIYGDPKWHPATRVAWDDFTNVVFQLRRVKPYAAYGRSQTEDEAQHIDRQIQNLMVKWGIPFTTVDGDYTASHRILNILKADHLVRS